MKLYWIKTQALRCVLALAKQLGVEIEFEEMDLLAGNMKTADYIALNPKMKAPTPVDGALVPP